MNQGENPTALPVNIGGVEYVPASMVNEAKRQVDELREQMTQLMGSLGRMVTGRSVAELRALLAQLEPDASTQNPKADVQTRMVEAARELERQVVAGKREGYTYADVASMAGGSHATAWKALNEAGEVLPNLRTKKQKVASEKRTGDGNPEPQEAQQLCPEPEVSGSDESDSYVGGSASHQAVLDLARKYERAVSQGKRPSYTIKDLNDTLRLHHSTVRYAIKKAEMTGETFPGLVVIGSAANSRWGKKFEFPHPSFVAGATEKYSTWVVKSTQQRQVYKACCRLEADVVSGKIPGYRIENIAEASGSAKGSVWTYVTFQPAPLAGLVVDRRLNFHAKK